VVTERRVPRGTHRGISGRKTPQERPEKEADREKIATVSPVSVKGLLKKRKDRGRVVSLTPFYLQEVGYKGSRREILEI